MTSFRSGPDAKGLFGRFGGQFVAETLMPLINQLAAEYEKAKDVTRQRLFLETLEDVLSKSNKVIIEEGKEGTGVVPYLPLPELQKRQNAPPARTATGAAQ